MSILKSLIIAIKRTLRTETPISLPKQNINMPMQKTIIHPTRTPSLKNLQIPLLKQTQLHQLPSINKIRIAGKSRLRRIRRIPILSRPQRTNLPILKTRLINSPPKNPRHTPQIPNTQIPRQSGHRQQNTRRFLRKPSLKNTHFSKKSNPHNNPLQKPSPDHPNPYNNPHEKHYGKHTHKLPSLPTKHHRLLQNKGTQKAQPYFPPQTPPLSHNLSTTPQAPPTTPLTPPPPRPLNCTPRKHSTPHSHHIPQAHTAPRKHSTPRNPHSHHHSPPASSPSPSVPSSPAPPPTPPARLPPARLPANPPSSQCPQRNTPHATTRTTTAHPLKPHTPSNLHAFTHAAATPTPFKLHTPHTTQTLNPPSSQPACHQPACQPTRPAPNVPSETPPTTPLTPPSPRPLNCTPRKHSTPHTARRPPCLHSRPLNCTPRSHHIPQAHTAPSKHSTPHAFTHAAATPTPLNRRELPKPCCLRLFSPISQFVAQYILCLIKVF